MVQRVLLGALGAGQFGLRVSRPGYDVSAGGTVGNKIAFDSAWSRALRILKRGQVEATASGQGPAQYVNISFGETMPSPPVVFVLMRMGVDRWQPAQLVGANLPFYSDNGAYVHVEDDRLRLLRPASGTRTYSYIIARRM